MEQKKESAPYLEQLTSEQDLKQAIEAILYAAGYPMRYDKLGELLGLSTKDIKTLVRSMADHFAQEDTHHGIQLLHSPLSIHNIVYLFPFVNNFSIFYPNSITFVAIFSRKRTSCSTISMVGAYFSSNFSICILENTSI